MELVFCIGFIGAIIVDIGECRFECGIVLTKRVFCIEDNITSPCEGFAFEVGDDKENFLFIGDLGTHTECEMKRTLRDEILKVGNFARKQFWRRDLGVVTGINDWSKVVAD